MRDKAQMLRECEPSRVLVAYIQGLGDLVIGIPALRAIRSQFPNAQLDLLAPDSHIQILEGQCGIDRLIPFPSRLWLHRTPANLIRTMNVGRQLRRRNYDLLVNLTTPLSPSSWFANWIFPKIAGPQLTIGPKLQDCIYSRRFLKLWRLRLMERNRIPERDMKFRFLERLRITDHGDPPHLTITTDLQRWSKVFVSRWVEKGGETKPLVGLCVGGSRTTSQYPLDRLASAIQDINRHIRVNWLGFGSTSESADFHRLEQLTGASIMCTAGFASIIQVSGLVQACDLMLSNDTGLMHVAAAVDTPVIGIFGPGDVQRYAPLTNRRSILHADAPCSPCQKTTCSHHSCLQSISPGMIASAVMEMLAKHTTSVGVATTSILDPPTHPSSTPNEAMA